MTPEEARIIAWTLLGEAAGEGFGGMEAIAHVIRNRSLSGRFPSNPASVAIQGGRNGYFQFSAWNPVSKGGNAPRARYPVGSQPMNNALRIVERVFGPTPGNDPTQGATHYFSPSGMPGGKAPYWWGSEASRGEKKIGRHIFAIRHDGPVPPSMPTARPTDLGGAVVSVRPGPQEQVRLPQIFFPPVSGTPTPMPREIEWIRQNNEKAISRTTYQWDPISKEMRPMRTDFVERAVPAKERQVVAGFSVPSKDTVRRADMTRQLQNQGVSLVERNPPKKNVQTVFGPNTLPKDETRLQSRPLAYPGGAVSRDSIAKTQAGREAVAAGVLNKPPVTGFPTPASQRPQQPHGRPAPVQQPRVQVVQPPPATLKIVVTRDSPSEQIREPASFTGTATGRSYQEGQRFQLGRDTVRAEADGTFTNERTGRSVASGTDWQSRHGLS